MKKHCRKGAVHPSPPPSSSNPLAFLPAVILTLAAVLTPDERQVLAYLLSCPSGPSPATVRTAAKKKSRRGGGGGDRDHSPAFGCNCFRCYKSFWARWDSSPNRQLIHEIMDAYEDWVMPENRRISSSRKRRGRKEKTKKGVGNARRSAAIDRTSDVGPPEAAGEGGSKGGGGEKATVVSFIGEKIWRALRITWV